MLSFSLRSFLLHTFWHKSSIHHQKRGTNVAWSYDKKTRAQQVIPLVPGYRTAISSHPDQTYLSTVTHEFWPLKDFTSFQVRFPLIPWVGGWVGGRVSEWVNRGYTLCSLSFKYFVQHTQFWKLRNIPWGYFFIWAIYTYAIPKGIGHLGCK